MDGEEAMQGLDEATSAGRRDQVFAPRPGGLAEWVGPRLGAQRPLLAALTVWGAAFVLLGAAIIGLGVLLTRVLVPAGLGGADADVVTWLAGGREPLLDSLTTLGTYLGSTEVILGVALLAGGALLVARLRRHFGFLLFAMTLEFSLFLFTVLIVDRQRPRVEQLDAAPPTSSFPSGHTAASVTLYIGLAIVGSSLVRGRLATGLIWGVGIALPLFVGLSRLYRGMHFPSDVAAGTLLAVAALLISLLAVRSTAAASAARACRQTDCAGQTDCAAGPSPTHSRQEVTP